MAQVVHDDEDAVSRGFGSTIGVILAIVLVLALLIGGWWLFFREPVDVTPDTNINIEQDSGNGETTTSP